MPRTAMTGERSPLIVGAGPAGLATAYALERAGMRPRVVERSDSVCSSWEQHYDSLRLNSVRWWSSLPGMRMERRLGVFVARDDFIDYVRRYARRLRTEIEFGVDVHTVERAGGDWRVETSAGSLPASHVVIAAGVNAVPYLPDWPGRASFTGELIHARAYRRPDRFRGRDVLVVGLGSTGADISVDLARNAAGRVRVAVRTPPIIMRRAALTAPMTLLLKYGPTVPWLVNAAALGIHRLLWGDLTRYGLATPTEGLVSAMARRSPGVTIDPGLVSALKQRAIEIVPALEGFDGADVILRDRRIRPEAVIAATGQRPGLEPLVGHLGVLDSRGWPLVQGGATIPGAPGLHFIGYRLPPGQLPDMRFDARSIARAVARVPATAPAAKPPRADDTAAVALGRAVESEART
jgi:putative flavoprotein involved in K+ transport